MDVFTHTLSGVAVGGCLSLYAGSWKEKGATLCLSALGSALPDIDAISLWSGFDATIGRIFNLAHPGKDIYSAKLWYSHHGFMHSLLAALAIAFILGLIFRKKWLLPLGFFFGFVIHLLEDMITPAGSWGGVRLFFPSETYIGGTGNIWWWNNYDIFLVISFVSLIILALQLFLRFDRKNVRRIGTITFFIGFLIVTLLVETRTYNFNGKPYQTCEDKSKEIQQKRLPRSLYRAMESLDKALPFYF
ncbi:inner membrane protein [Parabacteroides sp. PF5-5]|uniref:metal-dependent hydrolase n=1 Tax=unclassified Parabacteroides TaxID=2649774 RepID=UPI00247694D3|nr:MULTISPECIES: metal-dependent hydrolase [unclassified Parabacteroides]MDH6304872.1 inner membrane protein [Parabacteroides sp. PH5-39]MDH6316042.1 inner membrane protein [Parabacteroides sp. PF5-13]MDH6319699.1 inner membrane protein [Parabacteroides sp. PH5-13]MDH6323430.1 inner membrane protein [Parabacteroides sp. PH5-8]MDH6327062.1 inner membrane protein [Parabacteroides sp. PH5-41]